jgi:hypothetical protein
VNYHKKVWAPKPETFGFDITFLKKYVKKDWRTRDLNPDQYHGNFKHMKGYFPGKSSLLLKHRKFYQARGVENR